MKPTRRFLLAGAFTLLFGLLESGALHSCGLPPDAALPEKVLIAPFAIEPAPLENTGEHADRAAFLKRLSEEAVKEAKRSVVRNRVAVRVEQTPHSEIDALVLSGTVRLPILLPPGMRGYHAARRRGVLASATVRLCDARGKLLREERATLNWDNVLWTRAYAKRRRDRPVDAVLADATRKVVGRAIEPLGRSTPPPADS